MNQPTNQCFYFLFLFYRAYHPSIFIKKHLLSSIQMVKQDRFSHVSRIFPMIFLSFLLFPPGAFDILSGFWGEKNPHIFPGRSHFPRFTPIESGLGGMMIGAFAAMAYLIDGKITGISGAKRWMRKIWDNHLAQWSFK